MIWSRFMKVDRFAHDIPGPYLRGNFEPTDRLAVVLVNKQATSVIQRVATAERIADQDFQAWLRHQNAQRYEIYVSMNALREDARGRTKEDIAVIRHVYLDFDHDGNAAVQTLFGRQDLPTPSYVVNTSLGKWQVSWRVEGFTKDEAEDLQRALARDTGADPAATDCARVLRFPGFYNHKYDRPYLVRVEPHAAIAGLIYRPDQFPKFSRAEPAIRNQPGQNGYAAARNHAPGTISQSERDWAFARRALARGEPEETVIAAIASYRRHEKHNPQYYAEHTVQKAVQSLRDQAPPARSTEPER
jgi:hypothetical protein